MRLILLSTVLLSSICSSAQNLMTNTGAEAATVGSGWIIASSPSNSGCGTATAVDWRTLGSAISTTPHSGTYVFYPGCNATTGGTYEIYQDVNITSDLAAVDAGAGTYTFVGWYSNYNQASPDQSRFIEEFRNASNGIISSYNSPAVTTATNTSASQGPWARLVHTATVPVGTRTVRIRLQAVHNSGSAIDAYFDDISLVRGAFPLPLSLTDFTSRAVAGGVEVKWNDEQVKNNVGYNVYWSTNASDWQQIGYTPVAAVNSNAGSYTFLHNDPFKGNNYYRIASVAKNGTLDYSQVVNTVVNTAKNVEFTLAPNPASNELNITLGASANQASATIINMQGQTIRQIVLTSGINKVDLSNIAAGNYIFSLTTPNGSEKRLLVINK